MRGQEEREGGGKGGSGRGRRVRRRRERRGKKGRSASERAEEKKGTGQREERRGGALQLAATR
eukprot:3836384-Rhodomonas_salina.1